MRDLSDPLLSKRLHLSFLARRLEGLERSGPAANPVAYRLFARRLHQAMAGYPPGALAAQLGADHPAVLDALACRHFDDHRRFPGGAGQRACQAADALLRRVSTRAHRRDG